MEKKYIYANIRLPIEISDNGSFYEIHSDRMIIDFELCETLPEPTTYENQEMIAKIFAIHRTGKEPESEPAVMKILKREMKNKCVKTRQNLSFRSRENRKGAKKFTQRVYSSIISDSSSNTSAGDPTQLPDLSV